MGKTARPFHLLFIGLGRGLKALGTKIFHWLSKSDQSAITEDVNQQLVIQLNQKVWPTWSQLKKLPRFLNLPEKIRLLAALIIFLVSSFTLTWRIYAQNSSSQPKAGGHYSEGLVGVPRLVNPLLAATDVDRDLVKLIYAGLLKYDGEGHLVPDLAQAYIVNPEQTSYTFELRPNLYWQDGQPLTTDDVIFTINRLKNPEFGSPFRASFNGVDVKKINDQAVQFVLEKPFAPFLSILTIGLLPEHLWYSIPGFGASLADLNIKPVGSGPYKFKSLTKDTNGNLKTYTLEAYEDYHGGPVYIKEFTFKFYPDFVTALTALENKNVDGLGYLPKEYKDQIKKIRVTLNNLQLPQYTALYFNPKNNSLLEDNKLRLALALALDKTRILSESIDNDGQLITGPLLPGLPGHDPELSAPDYQADETKKILEELGWKIAEGQTFRQKSEGDKTTELKIKLSTVDQMENVRAANIIKENWEALGIKTELEIVSKDRIKQSIIDPRQYEILLFSQLINVSAGPYAFWHSSQNQNPGLNLTVMANKDVDKYLEEYRQVQTEEAKIESLKNFQKKLIELNFAIFLYNPTYSYPTSPDLRGLESLQFINLPADRFNTIHSWYLKTQRVLNKK